MRRRDRRLAREVCYFAYGSNLHSLRLRLRVPSARLAGVARLSDFTLQYRKRGRDRSGKCDIAPQPGGEVFGVVYRLPGRWLRVLDAVEGRGYRRVRIQVMLCNERRSLRAYTYRARAAAVVPGLKPMQWYRDLVVAGAQQHGLPRDYVNTVLRSPARHDSHFHRTRSARTTLLHRPLRSRRGGPR